MREETFARGPCPGGHPYRAVPARESALHRAVSEQEQFVVNISCFISEDNNRDVCLVVRIVAFLNSVRLRGIFFRR